jgi:hypothetical protein
MHDTRAAPLPALASRHRLQELGSRAHDNAPCAACQRYVQVLSRHKLGLHDDCEIGFQAREKKRASNGAAAQRPPPGGGFARGLEPLRRRSRLRHLLFAVP